MRKGYLPENFSGFKGIAEKRKELRSSNLVHKFLLHVGLYSIVFDEIAHVQRVAAIELFWFYRYC